MTRIMLLDIASDTDIVLAHVDISDEQSVQDFVNGAVKHFGRIDFACNIAGIVPPRAPMEDTLLETFDRVVDVNAYGVRKTFYRLLQQNPY